MEKKIEIFYIMKNGLRSSRTVSVEVAEKLLSISDLWKLADKKLEFKEGKITRIVKQENNS